MKPAFIFLFAILLSALTAFATVKITAQETASEVKKESVYDRVMRTQTIRCGYTPIEPILRKDASTGELSGVAYDIVNEIGKKLNLKIEWAGEAGFASMTQDVASGRYDMICSVHMITAARARGADFSTPVVFAPLSIFVRSDDDRFDVNPDLLNDEATLFASVDGTPAPGLVAQFFPKAKLYSLPELSSMSEAFISVASKKADVVLTPAYEGVLFAEKNEGRLRPLAGGTLVMMPNAFQFAQDQYRFKSLIEATLEELRAYGTVDRIVRKYERFPGTLYASRSPYAPMVK